MGKYYISLNVSGEKMIYFIECECLATFYFVAVECDVGGVAAAAIIVFLGQSVVARGSVG